MTEPGILYLTNGSPSYMPPLRLSMRQVEMGPNMQDALTEDGRIRRHIEAGNFPSDKLLAKLPEGFLPDLTFIQASSYRCAKPTHLERLTGRKFLVIADAHHGSAPISSMLTYLSDEAFDGVIVTHGAHFAHWFAELGRCPVAVIPNFNVAGHALPFKSAREPVILFVGQAGDFHPRRRHLLDAIKQAGLPLIEGQAEPEDAARLYGKAQIVFNCSLNGDINMRVFEVLAAGGCLVTDRLSPQAGLERLFENGRHLALYDSLDDLIPLLKRLLASPLDALALAEAGQREYLARHAPFIRKKQVLDFALSGIDPGILPVPAQDRLVDSSSLFDRVCLYETLQEKQRALISSLPLFIDPSLPGITGLDANDLVRFNVSALTQWPEGPALILAKEGWERLGQAGNGQTVITYSSEHQD
ncbi:MAG: glycosyltransferase family 1 protein [Rhodospirillales bacterium]|nr:MAG: glycosyltransferase family 1 protein [Rhodospirillales bacterium]